MSKNKVQLYYVLRKRNTKEKDPNDIWAYKYIHGKLWWRDTEYDIGAAKLFNSKEETLHNDVVLPSQIDGHDYH